MKSKKNASRLVGVVALAFAAVLVFASTSNAQLLNICTAPAVCLPPSILFDSGGTTRLVVVSPTERYIEVVATPLFIDLPGFSPIEGGTFTIKAHVTSGGALIPGVAGDGLVITGLPVFLPLSPDLLTGEVVAMGYANPPDVRFDFRFHVTNGSLAPYFDFYDIAVLLNSVGSSFSGTFDAPFTGGAAGDVFKTPQVFEGLPDTTPPEISGDDIEVQAIGSDGTLVSLGVTATDLGVNVPVVCSPLSGSLFPIGVTVVNCHATDLAGNTSTLDISVTVKVVPPAITGEGCFILDFREITYFKGAQVIMSSDAGIRTRNNIAGAFNPAVWPYKAIGGSAYTTSRGTLFRVYGFQPAELGREVQNADATFIKYVVKLDSDTKGYYIDLGGPARVVICEAQLHKYVLTGKKGNGHKDGSTLLPVPQRNVPGVMLTHNAQIVKVPNRVRWEMSQLGLNAPSRGLIDYIGFQLQGNGNAAYREFVDVEVSFPGDSATDRKKHYESGFHTATNTNFETFAGCSYLDSAPGNDAVRLRDVWGPNRSRNLGYWSYQACGTREPAANQKVRANYEIPFNAIQILPTVNSATDTLRMFYGTINPLPERERNKRDHKLDWADWDRWDH